MKCTTNFNECEISFVSEILVAVLLQIVIDFNILNLFKITYNLVICIRSDRQKFRLSYQ